MARGSGRDKAGLRQSRVGDGAFPPPDLTPRPPLPSPHLPPGEGAPPPKTLKKEGWGFPLSRLVGGRWERGPGGEVQGCGASGDFDGALLDKECLLAQTTRKGGDSPGAPCDTECPRFAPLKEVGAHVERTSAPWIPSREDGAGPCDRP